MSAEDYKKISFGFRPDNRFFIFRDAAAKKTGFSFRIPFGQAAIHPIQLIHLLLSPVRILFLLIAPPLLRFSFIRSNYTPHFCICQYQMIVKNKKQ